MLFLRELETGILEHVDFLASKFCSNLHRPGQRDWQFIFVVRERNDPLAAQSFHTALDIISAKKELHGLLTVQANIAPNSGVGRCRSASTIDDDSGRAFLLSYDLLYPTTFGRCERDAGNVPELLINLRFLNSCNATEIESSSHRREHLLNGRSHLFNDCRQSSSSRSYYSLTKTRAQEIDSVRAMGLAVGSNWCVRSPLLRPKHFSSLKVRLASTKILCTRHVKKGPLKHYGVASPLSTALRPPQF